MRHLDVGICRDAVRATQHLDVFVVGDFVVWIGVVRGDVIGGGSGDVVWAGGTWGRGLHSVGGVVRPVVGSVEPEKKDKIL